MHWADVVAEKLMKKGGKHILATAITPSGPIHIGNMREVLTTEAIYRALIDRGGEAKLIYIGDTYDPLRKVYPFLPKSYEKHVGKPLSEIPCPCGKHENYALHFLSPFLKALEELGIHPEVYLAHEMYEKGKYNEAIKTALDNAAKIKKIIEKISGRDLPDGWMPFNVKCSKCGKLNASVIKYEYPFIEYSCECGYKGKADVRNGGIGKLPWRVDWPARWKIFGVTFEAFGKDHAASGGSWDTGKVIVEEVYKYPAPMPLVYEFIHLKGKGAMHGSTGTAIAAEEMLHMTPPEVLRFLLMKYEPSRHIEFDSGLGLLDLVDEYDKYERIVFEGKERQKHREMKAREVPREIDLTRALHPVGSEKGLEATSASHDFFFVDDQTVIEISSDGNVAKGVTHEFADIERVYELSQPNARIPEKLPVQVPYRHIVTLVQIAKDWKGVFEILRRNGEIEKLSKYEEEKLKERIKKAQYWLKNFAPEQIKFEVKEKLPLKVSREQKRFFEMLKKELARKQWNAEVIHATIHEVAKSADMPASKAFQYVYQLILGQKKGPRAGYFIHSLGREFIMKRLDEAIES